MSKQKRTMRILKFILSALLVLLLIVAIRGLLTPSISYTSTVSVDKSVEEAWAVMNDESKTNEWLKGITKVEHMSGEKGKVGAVTKYTFDDDGRESEIVETMKTIVPNSQVAMDFLMEGVMTMDYKMDLVQEGTKTNITSSTTTKGLGLMMKAMIPFMKATMQAQEDENMGNLKKVIEANTTRYFDTEEVLTEEGVVQ